MKPRAVNDEDVRQVLKKQFGDDNYVIIDVIFKSYFEEINGFLGDHNALIIKLKRNDDIVTLKYFVKCLPTRNTAFLDFTLESNSFGKEVFFYTKFLGHMKQLIKNYNERITPYFYHGENGIVVLEDLSLEGYVMAKSNVMDIEHVRLALKSLAKLHTISYVIEEYETKRRKQTYRLSDDYGEYLKEGMFLNDPNWAGYRLNRCSFTTFMNFINFLPKSKYDNGDFQKEFAKEYDFMMNTFVKPNLKWRNVCCHGDLWMNNLVFKYDDNIGGDKDVKNGKNGEELMDSSKVKLDDESNNNDLDDMSSNYFAATTKEDVAKNTLSSKDGAAERKPINCLIIDFQLLRYAPPGHDVTFLLYQILNEELMRTHYHDFLKLYYDYLKEELKRYELNVEEILTLAEYEETCRVYLRFIKIIKTFYSTLNAASQIWCQRIMENTESFNHFLFVERHKTCKEIMKDDPEYRRIIFEMITNVRDSIYNKLINQNDCYYVINNYRKLNQINYHKSMNNYEIINYEFKPSINSNDLKLTITINEENANITSNYNFIVGKNVGVNEHYFYTKIYVKMPPEIKGCVQASYLIRHDVNVLQCCHGYQALSYDKTNFESQLNQLRDAIKSLVKFHAIGLINSPIDMDLFEASTILTESNELSAVFKENVILTLENYLRDYNQKRCLIDFVADLLNDYNAKLKPSKSYKNVLSHNNLNLRNVLFRNEKSKYKKSNANFEDKVGTLTERAEEVDEGDKGKMEGEENDELKEKEFEERVKFKNLNRILYAPPIRDILNLIYATTNKEFRTQQQQQQQSEGMGGLIESILKFYYEELNFFILNSLPSFSLSSNLMSTSSSSLFPSSIRIELKNHLTLNELIKSSKDYYDERYALISNLIFAIQYDNDEETKDNSKNLLEAIEELREYFENCVINVT